MTVTKQALRCNCFYLGKQSGLGFVSCMEQNNPTAAKMKKGQVFRFMRYVSCKFVRYDGDDIIARDSYQPTHVYRIKAADFGHITF